MLGEEEAWVVALRYAEGDLCRSLVAARVHCS